MNKNDYNTIDKQNQQIKNRLIAEGIRQVRKVHGYSLDEIAKYLEISVTDLLLFETGEKEIDCSLLVHLSRFYNVSVDEFFVCLKSSV